MVSWFKHDLQDAQVSKNDAEWFPRRVARYATGKTIDRGRIPVTLDLVVGYSKSLIAPVPPSSPKRGSREFEARLPCRVRILRQPLAHVCGRTVWGRVIFP
jgi:hypothetical protein